MSAYRRAKQPLNEAAQRAANAAVAAETGGRPLTMGPEDAKLRKKWMDAYIAAGGESVVVKPRGRAPSDPRECCPVQKMVTAQIVALTFRSDHLDSASKKLLKKSSKEAITVELVDEKKRTTTISVNSSFGDTYTEFLKPEWDRARGGSADSHPISHTKGLYVQVDVDIEFTVTPQGQSAIMTEISGVSSDHYLTFEKKHSQTVKTQRITIPGLTSKGVLPDYVDLLEGSIDWSVMVDGEERKVGTTGKHTIYVTFDTPRGKMASPSDNSFTETGPEQIVTEERLKYSVKAAKGKGKSNEQECVDAIFLYLMVLRVGYVLYHRWENDLLNNTHVLPKPSLHHYLWLCNAATAKGECHNIAAAFALACRILGVKGSFEVGYMYPWPSRQETHPTYPKSTDKSASGKNILGKYNVRYIRTHTGQGHGSEALLFLDGAGDANNFEGVATYNGNALYAIGDDVFDHYPDPHDNASSYYTKRDMRSGGIRRRLLDWDEGSLQLVFVDLASFASCSKPYPWKTAPPPPFKWVPFKWEE